MIAGSRERGDDHGVNFRNRPPPARLVFTCDPVAETVLKGNSKLEIPNYYFNYNNSLNMNETECQQMIKFANGNKEKL